MRVLVVGSGGREHALVWKISQSKLVDKIFCAPGNGGIGQIAECIEMKPDDIDALVQFARREEIGLTVVGPEVPLAAGIVDIFQANKLKIFGPTRETALLEASKVFAKDLMRESGIPTAEYKVFQDDQTQQAYDWIQPQQESKFKPVAVKADGLAAGKGVIVAQTQEEARLAIKSILEDKDFKEAGKKIIIEDCLYGQEASILVFSDGRNIVPLASSQDHKRVFDGDIGPNTGGMGSYSPAPIVTEKLFQQILKTIINPVIETMAKRNTPYKGVLYAGLMLTKYGPKVLEFNVRFGDPEIQAILPRLKSDIVEVMLATIDGKLNKVSLDWQDKSCVCVVIASGGYPGVYQKGKEIKGLEKLNNIEDIVVFHAGTKLEVLDGKSKLVTNAGRVLGVTGLGETIKEAIDKTYKAVDKIEFEGMQYRRDIGEKALKK